MRKQRRLKCKLKEKPFFTALKNEVLNQQEFSKIIGSENPQYLSNLSKADRVDITASTTYARRILAGFNNKYSFDELMFWVE